MTTCRIHPPDLSRHITVVGQTGCGKTGLIVGMAEDLAMHRIPVILLDPKGDMGNLRLVFPHLRPLDFLPFLTPTPHAGPPEAEAARVANNWREGLAADGVTDLAEFVRRVDVQIHTPGGEPAPVDVLTSLTTCPRDLAADLRVLRITGAVSALLGIVELEADPINDRATILLSHFFDEAFAAGEDLPLHRLVQRVLDPGIAMMGEMPMDEWFPPKARQNLATRLNNVLVAPAFDLWRQGVSLDLNAWTTPGPDGRTPVHVLSLAHLSDAERMFFVTFFLHAVVAWTRSLPGTHHPRCAVIFDEVSGYLPPHPKNPTSKAPLMTLLKSARAVGVGVIVATQNPVDLDYKALSNTGTWFLGRLQTAGDRDRVLGGMGGPVGDLPSRLARLPPRTFVVRRPDGSMSQGRARHTRAWLRGPLTRVELIRLLAAPDDPIPPVVFGADVAWLSPAPPELAPAGPGWHAAVYLRATARIDDGGQSVERVRHRWWLRPHTSPLGVDVPAAALRSAPPHAAAYGPLPDWVDQPAELDRLRDEVVADLQQRVRVLRWSGAEVTGDLGEPEEAVRARATGPITARAVPPASITIDWCGIVWLSREHPA